MGLLRRTCPTEVELADQQSRPHEKTHHHEKRRKMQLIGHLTSKELPKNTETHKKNFTITVFKIFKETKRRNRIHNTSTGEFGGGSQCICLDVKHMIIETFARRNRWVKS